MTKFNDAFWKWFGDSKVVDKQGQPLVVYHGADESFFIFKEGEGTGIFFSDSKDYAREYGWLVRRVFLRAVNPYITTPEKFDRGALTAAKAKEAGYDSYIMDYGDSCDYAVFSPTQIKSADQNDGTWDADDPDIRSNSMDENPYEITPTMQRWRVDEKVTCVVLMKPMDFLKLTTAREIDRDIIKSEAATLDDYNQSALSGRTSIPPFLGIDPDGTVIAHEGRHRVAAVLNNNEEVVPISIKLRDSYGYSRQLSFFNIPWIWKNQFTHLPAFQAKNLLEVLETSVQEEYQDEPVKNSKLSREEILELFSDDPVEKLQEKMNPFDPSPAQLPKIESLLKSNWEKISERLGAEQDLLPVCLQEVKTKQETLFGEEEVSVDCEQVAPTLGCGHYGCVYSTSRPGWIFKITTDESEALFIQLLKYLEETKSFEIPAGITSYLGVFKLKGKYKSYETRPAFCLWRQEAFAVGEELDEEGSVKAYKWNEPLVKKFQASMSYSGFHGILSDLLHNLDRWRSYGYQVMIRLRELRKRLGKEKYLRWLDEDFEDQASDSGTMIGFELKEALEAAENLASNPFGGPVGEALLSFYEQKILLVDIHAGNLGHVQDSDGLPVITDPGYAVPLTSEYKDLQVPWI